MNRTLKEKTLGKSVQYKTENTQIMLGIERGEKL